VQATQKLPAEEQVKAVGQKLQELNPGFDGKVYHTIEGNHVVAFRFAADRVSDLAPVRALSQVIVLHCRSSATADNKPLGRIVDLSPLHGLPLTHLYCSGNPISNLSPLRGMKLVHLSIHRTPLADLRPLEGMPLTLLDCSWTAVTDLSPLRNAPLEELWVNLRPEHVEQLRNIPTLKTINFKPAADALKEALATNAVFDRWVQTTQKLPAEQQVKAVAQKLRERNPGFDGKVEHKIENGKVAELTFLTDVVADLSPVRALPGLQRLVCNATQPRPGDPTRGKLADLSPLRGMPLTELYCNNTQVSDLSPLQGLLLTRFNCFGTRVSDLSPLRGMPLTQFNCGATLVTDLSTLRGMPLEFLQFHGTAVADLSPLTGMKLRSIDLYSTKVVDLTPLKQMPIYHLWCQNRAITDLSPLKEMPLLRDLACDFNPQRDAEILRSIKTLEKINNRPVAEFWKQYPPKP
jgi:Leucine-rich repeat (LRR) protein